MSRKGKMAIPLPKGVEIKIEGTKVTVKGPKATLTQDIDKNINVSVEDGHIVIAPKEGVDNIGNLHGLYRSLINNMVIGAAKGFDKQLEMVGVGYRASVQGSLLDISVGHSHPIKMPIPQGITVKVDKQSLTISGSDKQQVGQYAATIRAIRPPEPYQGKGIRYAGEYVRKKQGKTAGKK